MHLTRPELLGQTSLFLHGCTVVDNTLLTLDGARTGLLITEGFEDTLRVTRGAYGRWSGLSEDRIKHPVATHRPDPLVPRDRIRGVAERVDCQGAVLRPLDEAAAEQAIRALVRDRGVEALAVCLLWSFYHPEHERRLKALIERVAPGVYVTLSSAIAPVPGEYERASTTVINAYAGRVTRDYLAQLQALLSGAGYSGPILVMQGHGGLVPVAEAGDRAVNLIECGPVAGLIGSRFLGEVTSERNIIAADMGGTTFKVGVIEDGMLEYSREPMVNRYHYLAPKIEVVSIGAGGGSIVSLEPGTRVPRVGPRSAGARPGPVSYGQGGTEPTLTDVMLLVGYMDEGHFLGGSLTLDAAGARRAFAAQIAEPLGMTVEEAAFGIYRVAAAQAYDLIHEITVERGLDPRDFVLHAYGGTCPMLAAVFAQELSVRNVVVPYTASVNGAFGLAAADVVHEYATTKTRVMPAPPGELNALFAPMVGAARDALAREGFAPQRTSIEWSVGMRYGRQVHEIVTPVRAPTPLDEAGLEALIDDFEKLYERRYGKGSAYREAGVEVTQFRVTARGRMERPALAPAAAGGADAGHARIGTRPIFVEARGAFLPAGTYDFLKLAPGNVVAGPAVIHTPVTTIVVQERQTGRMDAFRNIIIEFG
jgi:N-methylhydantoinase A